MKIALISNHKGKAFYSFGSVYCEDALRRIAAFGECSPLLGKGDLEAHKDFLRDCEVMFSTWGMPSLTEEELERYLPKLKICFYAAGTVQHFARPLLNRGIRLTCAAAANAVPVAEYAFAQIILAAKGAFGAQKYYRRLRPMSFRHGWKAPGSYGLKVGLLGVGAIGSMVAERLKTTDAQVLAYDPFLPQERAETLNIRLVSLEEIFTECDVISNHLANKDELIGVLNGKLFKLMKPRAAFINTGRGTQVREGALALALLKKPGRTALLDVLRNEATPFLSPLWWCPNAYFTPHIAGSMGNECHRMADYMIAELERWLAGEALLHEVTQDRLERMA